MSDATETCELLDWDTTFFGRRIARVRSGRLNADGMNDVLRWCGSQRIECLYLLVGSGDSVTSALAESHGFHLTDLRVTLARSMSAGGAAPRTQPGAMVRPWRAEDLAALRAIARVSHRDTRFYHDAHFPRDRCDALYETWIDKSCQGWADAVLVAEAQGAPCGYVTGHLRDGRRGQIGLFAVAATARGEGVGQQLVEEMLRWLATRDVEHVTVATQGRNIAAQHLYQRCGFATAALELWYHLWLPA